MQKKTNISSWLRIYPKEMFLQLSWKTKQLVSDLKTLRTVLLYLTQYDCVTFLAFVSALRTTENAMRTGGWMILDAAETLFLTAR